MKSVRSRLFLILLLSVAGLLVLLAARYVTSTKTDRLIRVTYLIMRLDIRLLNMRGAEKNFLLTPDASELGVFDRNFEAFTEDGEGLIPLLESDGFPVDTIHALREETLRYYNTFQGVARDLTAVGLTPDDGMRFQALERIRKMESELKTAGANELLVQLHEIRAQVTESLNRQDARRLRDVDADFASLLKASAALPTVQTLVQETRELYAGMVKSVLKVGLTYGEGTLAQLQSSSDTIEDILAGIHDQLLPAITLAKQRAATIELSVQVATIILALIVVMALINSLRKSFDLFADHFAQAKTRKALIPIEELQDSEFQSLGEVANEMIASRFNAEEALQDLNTNLEDRVADGIKEIKGLNTEITETQREVVFTMGAIGEARSKETGNHVRRVAGYSYLLAIHCGVPQAEAELLRQASPMHDIGKIAIPDAILNKPGKLDDYEYHVMQTHAHLGFAMLAHSERPLLKTAAIVASQHHEKWNGKGYPNGTAGEDIHLYGRITALADVFDALGSERCYKPTWSDEKIFALLKEERGQHFDPQLVDIFFEHLDEFLQIRERYRDTGDDDDAETPSG
jgi:response regulator RpfG family c-di-GMP phosphodiesterase